MPYPRCMIFTFSAPLQRAGGATNELLANDERLRQPVRAGLHRVLQV